MIIYQSKPLSTLHIKIGEKMPNVFTPLTGGGVVVVVVSGGAKTTVSGTNTNTNTDTYSWVAAAAGGGEARERKSRVGSRLGSHCSSGCRVD